MIDYYTNIIARGDKILIRGVGPDGKEVRDEVHWEPTLYVEHINDYGYTSIGGKNLKPIEFEGLQAAREFAETHAGSNLKIYGLPYFHSTYASQHFDDSLEKWNKDSIRVFNIDIEVTSTEGFPEAEDAAFPVTAICIHDSITDTFVTFGDNKWEPEKSELSEDILKKVKYVRCDGEVDLLLKFLRFWDVCTPNIVTGWNLSGFDMPYLFNRLENLNIGGKKLSPWRRGRVRHIPSKIGRKEIEAQLDGIDIIDYMVLYKKNKIQESYRLDFVSEIELGEKKLDYSEVQGLHNLYFENYQKFIDYNIQDVNLVKRLDEKMGLIDAQIMIAYMAGINFSEVASPVRTWDCLINKEMARKNQIPHFHNIPPGDNMAPIAGGFVKPPQVGKHGWMMSFDLNSLYPHLIMQFNISPETFNSNFRLWPHDGEEQRIQKLLSKTPLGNVPKNHSISASGYTFSNEKQGIMPTLMRQMYEDRKKFKKQMIAKQQKGEDASIENLRQYVLKIMLNSGYGAIVNKYFRWFDRRLGESITLSGQFLIQVAEREINAWMNKVLQTENVDYIIAIDTDSNYVSCQALVDKFFSDKSEAEIVDILDKIAKEQVEGVLNKGFEEAKEYTNSFEQKMVMEREAIASSAFWTSKKRYAMKYHDMEGVRKTGTKIQGLEAIRSSTPQSCRSALLEMIELTLIDTEENLQQYIAEFKKKFFKMSIEEMSFPRSMNNVNKFTIDSGFIKGTPLHVRGAISHNRLIDRFDLSQSWEKIKNGEKGKYCYLKEPNIVGDNVISFQYSCPKEFEIDKYVDFEKMFEKAIVDPMKGILDPIGWTTEKQASLTDFFS